MDCQLSIQILDFVGNVIWEDSNQIQVVSNSSELKHELNLKTLQLNKNEVVVVLKFNDERSFFYLVKPKDLKLQKGIVNKTVSKTSIGFRIEVSNTTFLKDVFLYTNVKGHFSDNYFDLLPNETVEIEFVTKSEFVNNLKIKTFNNLIR